MWKMILLIILGLVVIIAIALVYGSNRWQSATKEMHAKLEAAHLPIGAKTYSSDELIGLPVPVQSYFRKAKYEKLRRRKKEAATPEAERFAFATGQEARAGKNSWWG